MNRAREVLFVNLNIFCVEGFEGPSAVYLIFETIPREYLKHTLHKIFYTLDNFKRGRCASLFFNQE